MNLAIGWACNLNDLFVRFPYEKCATIYSVYKNYKERLFLIKRIFRACINVILDDIIENNVTFHIPGFSYYGGEMHLNKVQGEEFINLKQLGKFPGVDFLESNFTAYCLQIRLHHKRDNFLGRRTYPVHFNKYYKAKLAEQINKGKLYC